MTNQQQPRRFTAEDYDKAADTIVQLPGEKLPTMLRQAAETERERDERIQKELPIYAKNLSRYYYQKERAERAEAALLALNCRPGADGMGWERKCSVCGGMDRESQEDYPCSNCDDDGYEPIPPPAPDGKGV